MTEPGPEPASDTGAESDGGSEFEGEGEHVARTPRLNVAVEAPPVEMAESLAAWWVSLANEQRIYDSHLLGEPNRALIREAMARHIVTDGLLVARTSRQGERDTGDTNDADNRNDPDDTNDETGTHDRGNATGESWALRPEGEENGVVGFEKGETLDGRAGDTNAQATNRAAGASEGVIVGFVMFGPETGSYEQSVDRGIIENVYVHPDYRNRGVGGALLDAAERALAESGVDVIALEAMATNEAARRLYVRRGYSPHRVELEAPIENLAGVERGGTDRSDDGSGDDSTDDRDRGDGRPIGRDRDR